MIFKKNISKKFPLNDFRNKYKLEFKEWILDQVKLIDKVNKGRDISSFALNFILYHKDVDYIIPGMRSKYQVSKVINSLKQKPLTKIQVNNIYKNIPIAYHGW